MNNATLETDVPTSHPVLIGCFEPPSFGGASTSAYQLFGSLQSRFDIHYLNLVQRDLVHTLRPFLGENMLNPGGLDNVGSCVLDEPPYGRQDQVREIIDRIDPSLLVGVGYIAAYILKKARPDLPLILITTGCEQVKNALRDGTLADASELLTGNTPVRITSDIEYTAFSQAEIIITHSVLTKRICEICFPEHKQRILNEVLWFFDWIHGAAIREQGSARCFDERDIDIVFVASDWSRIEKNYPLVATLAARFSRRSVHIVGIAAEGIETATHHGLLPHHEVLELLGRSRVLVCPSLFDAAPGILFEGAAMGCNLVASRNCGNFEICPPELVADSCHVDEFANRVERALAGAMPSNSRPFQEAGGLQELARIIEIYHCGRRSRRVAEG